MVIKMNCSYCPNKARFICGCQQPYMCGEHLETHQKTLGEHGYEILKINLGQSSHQSIGLDIHNRIESINKAKELIMTKTQSIIKTIEDVHKEAIDRLNSLLEECLEALKHQNIEKIEILEFDVKLMQREFTNSVEKRFV